MKEISSVDEIPSGLVLIDFYAPWCGPCKLLAPKLNELEKNFSNVTFCKVDVDDVEEMADEFSIEGLPTLIFFRDGKEIDRVVGSDLKKIESILSSF